MKKKGAMVLKTDGAARGNPGPSGVGCVLMDEEGHVLDESFQYIGNATNNVAEYKGLILGLQMAAKHRTAEISVFLDSELLVKQLNGEYKVKNAALKALYEIAVSKLKEYQKTKISHIPRGENKRADELANEAIDKHFDGETGAGEPEVPEGQQSLF